MLKFYNTPNRKLEEFIPQNPENVKIYTCGLTVYAEPHIGNWTAFIYWDILVRTLTLNGFIVNRTMNITDVGHLVSDGDEGEDKLEKGARKEGKNAWQVAEFYTEKFIKGMNDLNFVQPQHLSKATDYISQQIEIIDDLTEKGFTYETSDGIYFDTAKFPTYADFAHLNLEELKAGARVNFNPEKRNLADFALWKWSPTDKQRDMEWTYRDRAGFPGWHLECSAIALNTLGGTLDIHTGGIDHIHVHHTDEIAQSEAHTGEKFANYWLHANHLTIDGGKISKSLENGFTLDELKTRGFSPMDFRMFVLQSHYQKGGDFSFETLKSAQNRLKNWRNIAALRHQIQPKNGEEPSLASKNLILEAINNNLDTPQTLAKIDEIFTKIAKLPVDKISQSNLVELLEFIDELLGLQLLNSTPDISENAKRLILERRQMREEKNWAESDRIRDELLLSDGIILRDTPSKTLWEYA